ncbi:hypothetical protein B9W61_20045 [Streptomyces sp. CS057]|nr:hypothetical protein B9W61_20045 [Streptomyces sp. CS057]
MPAVPAVSVVSPVVEDGAGPAAPAGSRRFEGSWPQPVRTRAPRATAVSQPPAEWRRVAFIVNCS